MFNALYYGTNHMLGVDSYVPIMTNNFEIRIYSNGGLTGTGTQTSYSDLLTLSTDSIGAIEENQDDITVHYGNGIIRFPTKVTYGDVNWTLNCYCSPDVAGKLQEWRQQVYDPITERMGLPTEYMRNVYFIRYDPQWNCKQAIRCPGTWIKGLNYGDYNQAGGNVVQVQTTLVISKAFYMSEADLN